ncbi:MAG: hypothetical protein J0I12_27290 [Candidatus Eremiobacteraeota bacterium]|nr:hypothetical protein [Candidatus Eremiobacteraeota bacterium]
MKVSSQSPLQSLKPAFRPVATAPGQDVFLPAVGGVPYQKVEIRTFQGMQNNFLDPSALTTVEATFGKLSADQFARLYQEFGGRSQVAYDANRSYSAVDFLPPALQALVNQDLQPPAPVQLPQSQNLEMLPHEEDKTVDLTANCHATAYEAMAAYQGDTHLEIFNGEMIMMDDLVHGDKFQSLGDKPQKAGDLVQFYDTNEWKRYTMLLHSAVYVGGGLYFEKPNTEMEGEDSPYRLATWETLSKPVQTFSEGKFETQAFRPVVQLPQAAETFASGMQSELEQWSLSQTGQPLGASVCQSLEQSLGGGLRGEYATALAPQAILIDETGRGKLA